MPHKIIVVDDNPVTVELIATVLEAKGYEVITAADGLDALVKIKQEKPELVVLDVMMPEINGYDVCYQLRFNKDFEQIPIVLVTAREDEIPETVGERSNIEYMQKPVDTGILLQRIERLLSQG